MDHNEFAGPDKADIAARRPGIIKPGSAVVIGETDPDWSRSSSTPAARPSLVRGERLRRGREPARRSAAGCVDLRTPTTVYTEVFVPLHGRHQADNAAVALDRGRGVLRRAGGRRRRARGLRRGLMPGRFEVLGHQPLVIVDGAHNPAGADASRAGVLRGLRPGRQADPGGRLPAGRDPREMLAALRADEFDVVLTCTAPSPRGMPACDLTARGRGDRLRRGDRVLHGRAGLRACRRASPAATTPSSSPARSTSSARPARPQRSCRNDARPSRSRRRSARSGAIVHAGRRASAGSGRSVRHVRSHPRPAQARRRRTRPRRRDHRAASRRKHLHVVGDGPAHARRRHARPALRGARRQGLLRRPGRVHEPRPGGRDGGRGPGEHVGGRAHA